jgi:hypothetical protein
MSDTARDYQNFQTVDAEGLEEIFEVRVQDASCSRTGSSVREPSSSVREQSSSWASVEETAERLGISVRAVQKRLKKGTLTGRKEKTIHGERWLIAVREPVREQDASWTPSSSSVREPVLKQSEDSDRLIKEMQSKIDALIWRNGYLESQLETERERVQELKLLTDSQNKSGWWQRLSSWLTEQQ